MWHPSKDHAGLDDVLGEKRTSLICDNSEQEKTEAPRPNPQPAEQLQNQLKDIYLSKASASQSRYTNGPLVKLVGRCRLRNGPLITTATIAFALLLPPAFLIWLAIVRYRRGPECWFQLFGFGPRPQLSANLQTASSPPPGSVRFVCISDTHMMHRGLELPPGDVLVHCGDCTNWGAVSEFEDFGEWFNSQPHPHKILVPGNHEMLLDEPYYADYWSDWSSAKEDSKAAFAALAPATVLHDRLVTVAGVRVFGSSFVSCDGLPTRTGFNRTTAEMRAIWSKLPTCDVLLTHTPPRGAGDRTPLGGHDASCAELRDAIAGHACPPKFHVFGHVHTDWGAHKMPATGERDTGTVHINAASVSDYFVLRKDAAIVFDVIPGAARSLRA